jgi:class 3 adenylate cyclase
MEPRDPVLTLPDMSTRVLRHFLSHLVGVLGQPRVAAIAAEAGLSWEWIDADDHYVSRAFLERFAIAAGHQLYGLEGLAPREHALWRLWRDAGRETLSPKGLGPLFFVFRAMGSPRMAYSQVPLMLERGMRGNQAEIVRNEPGFVEIRARAADPEGSPDNPGMCWQRFGMLEGIPIGWRLPPARVEHTECLHDPDHPSDWCVYRVRYMEGTPAFLAWALLPGVLGAAAGWALSDVLPALHGPWLSAALGGLVGLSLQGLIRHRLYGGRTRRDAASLYDQMALADRRYRELWYERQSLRKALLAVRKIAGYLPPALVDEIMRSPERELRLGGRATDAAVLFVDLVSFTNRCESAPPEDVVDHLNLFFAHADPVIEKHRGIIDKRLGDGVMVVFTSEAGAESAADLRRRAIACGLSVLEVMQTCNRALAERGAPPLELRGGLAAGRLIQGNMGSPVRLEYTVIGDVVNVASRLNGHARPGSLLVEAEALSLAGANGFRVVERRAVQVKGRETPVEVVEIAP